MYTEEYEKRPFPFRDFLLKFIIIVIFALFLVWLIPKFISPKTSNKEISSSKVFQKNLDAMKIASVNYYSKKDNLPTENNKEIMTLRQMINKKMITAFTDKNGKACNVEKSYSEITSSDGEYVLKVKLKCNDEEDYVLTKLGNYSYCTSEICEKDLTKTDDNKSDVTKTDNVETPDTGDNDSSVDSTPSVVSYTYEYQKTTDAVLSTWEDWQGEIRNVNRYQAITCDLNDTSCLTERKISTKREVIGQTDTGRNIVATISYYQIRTRTYTPSTTDTKWSNENDENLLNAGYKMTGNKKILS